MVKRKRRLVALAAALVAGTAVLLGGVAGSETAGRTGPQLPLQAAVGQLVNGFGAGDTASYVAELERRVASSKRHDGEALTLLGLAYQQRARETGDPSFYPRSEEALRRALRLERGDVYAITGLAALAASRHRFQAARALAARAVRLSPSTAAPHGILGDALLELGRYREAFSTYDRMGSLKPNLASYSRVSHARELLGQVQGAIAAMELAVEAGSPTAEPAAWALVQLGNLHLGTGGLRAADRAYRVALAREPDYVYALAGRARVAAARGRTGAAVRLFRAALDRVPLPEFAVGLGDTLAVAGRTAEAHEAYELVNVIQRLFQANGVRTDLETALFDLDHDRNLAHALARARAAYAERKSIDAEDVLAWALYKNGRCEEALGHSERALRLGTRDALKLFHRGMIKLCLGKRPAGRADLRRALELNPHFSLLQVPVAREALR